MEFKSLKQSKLILLIKFFKNLEIGVFYIFYLNIHKPNSGFTIYIYLPRACDLKTSARAVIPNKLDFKTQL